MERRHELKVGKYAVTARELTVAEVLGIVDGSTVLPKGSLWLDHMLEGPIDSSLILYCADISLEDLVSVYPDEAQALANKVGEINPFFVRLLGKIRAKAEELKQLER